MKKYKFSWKDYYHPTPKNIRKWGDGLLVIGGFISAAAMTLEHHGLAITALIVSIAGKLLSNFFSESE